MTLVNKKRPKKKTLFGGKVKVIPFRKRRGMNEEAGIQRRVCGAVFGLHDQKCF
jgi:hypothetical protein